MPCPSHRCHGVTARCRNAAGGDPGPRIRRAKGRLLAACTPAACECKLRYDRTHMGCRRSSTQWAARVVQPPPQPGQGPNAAAAGAMRKIHDTHTEFVVGVAWSLFQDAWWPAPHGTPKRICGGFTSWQSQSNVVTESGLAIVSVSSVSSGLRSWGDSVVGEYSIWRGRRPRFGAISRQGCSRRVIFALRGGSCVLLCVPPRTGKLVSR